MPRIWLALLLAVSVAAAADVKGAYNTAKRKRGAEKKEFAREQATALEGQVDGVGYVYLGLLWQFAEDWDKAVVAFRAYLDVSKPTGKSRPRALLEIANSQVNGGKFADASATATEFLQAHAGHAYAGRVRYAQGRALRARGDVKGALGAFMKGDTAEHKLCTYEVADCLMQLGRYDDLKAHVGSATGDAARWKTLRKALPNLGQPLPKKLPIDYWSGRDLGMSEIYAKPVLWSFWTTKVGNARDQIHDMTNELARRFKGKAHVLGPAVYLQFNPVDMRAEPGMDRKVEQDYVDGWRSEFKLRYDLIVLDDNTLHDLCGIDPAYPALPAFAVSDRKGVLRYVRVGPERAATEAVAAMLERLLRD
jgi:tetratricopeptide (TPR) repeat protein